MPVLVAAPERTEPMVGRHRVVIGHQPEIQGLRAVAVTLVLIYHLWPNLLPGGYVGVDVFFVISGYLITSHIYREINATGALGLRQFWARRIRRLLPLSFLVLLFSVVMAAFVLPSTAWDSTVRQVGASALYVENWVLARDAVQYSAMDDNATVVQHYWSLSLEEQFYVLWPLLLIGTVVLGGRLARAAGRTSRIPARTLINYALFTVVGVSFLWSVTATATSPAQAYFVTPTRVWELGLGALVATLFLTQQFRGTVGNVLGWIGLGLILYSAVTFSETSAFPGWIAILPVGGAALVLQCGSARDWSGVHRWLSAGPATALGGLSYGVYLWHWPLIILTPFLLGAPLHWQQKLGIIAFAVSLAVLSKTFVEDPARNGAALRSLPRAFGFAAAGMALILAVGVALTPVATSTSGPAPMSTSAECYGPGSLDPANRCGPVAGNGSFVPTTLEASRQMKQQRIPGCQLETDQWPHTCTAGVGAARAKRTVAIVGDSFATRWIPTLDAIAKQQGWHVKAFTRSNCTASLALAAGEDADATRRAEQCLDAMRKVQRTIAEDRSISTVFVTGLQSDKTFTAPDGVIFDDPATDGMTGLWDSWTAAGKDVVAIDEIPKMGKEVGQVPACVESNRPDFLACGSDRGYAFSSNRFTKTAADSTSNPRVYEMSFDDRFCDDRNCYPVIGGVLVFADSGHITYEFAMAMVPQWRAQLGELGLLES